MIELAPEELRIVKDILARHVPGLDVRAFGSRVRGNSKPHSDLDLVVMAPAPMSLRALDALRDAFAESDLPFRVDIQDWSAVSPEFRKIIEEKHETLAAGVRKTTPRRA